MKITIFLFAILLTFQTSLTAQHAIPCEYCIDDWGESVVYKPSENVEKISNLTYVTYGDRELKLDVYLPKKRRQNPTPAILCIHGGGWKYGDKEMDCWMQFSNNLAAEGYVVANIDYRLSEEAPYPAAVKDCRAAVQWMKHNAEKYGIDKDAIGVLGGSAGGHLTLMMGTSDDSELFENEAAVSNVSSKVDAVVAMAPPADMIGFYKWYESENKLESFKTAIEFLGASPADNPKLAKEASPVFHADENSAPALLIVSTADEIVNYHQSVTFMEAYTKSRVHTEGYILSNAPHFFWGYQAWFDESFEKALKFFNEYVK